MKNLFIILLLATSTFAQAQNQYASGMQKALGLWGEGKSVEAVALFERIGQAEETNWLPMYYAANVLISSSFNSKDVAERTAKLEKAERYIKKAHDLSPDNSEIITLEGVLFTGYVAMDPGTYGMLYSQKIMELHGKAISLDPSNPRAHANSIEYEMGSARFFKQDLAPLCARLQETLVKFDQQKNEDPFAPTYGKERVQQVIANCGK